MVPADRIEQVNDAPVRPERELVVYWMIAARRTTWNHGLERAIGHARALRLPLLVVEGLRCGARWSCDRFHRFVIEGMRDNARAFDAAGVTYWPWVEPEDGAGKGLIEALGARAAVVVTDRPVVWFLPRMVAAAGRRLDVRLEAVDSNGVVPLAQPQRAFSRAASFRRHIHKHVGLVEQCPEAEPLRAYDGARAQVSAGFRTRWPAADLDALHRSLAGLPIDHGVGPSPLTGGTTAGLARWRAFLDGALGRYADEGRDPDADATTRLSPWLHFGHLSSHQVLAEIFEAAGWDRDQVSTGSVGKRDGFWGLSEPAESLIDELITWRELAHCEAWRDPEGFQSWAGQPDWAKKTLAEHASDPRDHVYTLDELADAATADPLWNACQRQLRATGFMPNYLRMLWGKRVLEWREDPEDAYDTLLELNNRYFLDGRDANSWSGVGWVFGRFDRAWGPERPIYGKIRFMSSERTIQKLKLKRWLEAWS